MFTQYILRCLWWCSTTQRAVYNKPWYTSSDLLKATNLHELSFLMGSRFWLETLQVPWKYVAKIKRPSVDLIRVLSSATILVWENISYLNHDVLTKFSGWLPDYFSTTTLVQLRIVHLPIMFFLNQGGCTAFSASSILNVNYRWVVLDTSDLFSMYAHKSLSSAFPLSRSGWRPFLCFACAIL